MHTSSMLVAVLLLVSSSSSTCAAEPTRAAVSAALCKAVTFHREQVSRHGGYVYASSGDLKLREGEGVVGEDTIWVQPPGTPTVGEAYLDAYDATREELYLDAAREVGEALLRGQLESGGWNYRIEFGLERLEFLYRTSVDGQPRDVILPKKGQNFPSGWDTWRTYRIRGNQTVLDDDTTQAATRFLCRLDQSLQFKDARIHEATAYALKSLLAAQYPNGGWSANYDRFPKTPPSEKDYPILQASLPQEVSQTWPKDFTGCYVTNDNLVPDMLDTLWLAYDIYQDECYLVAAKRAGDFLLLAQLPEPQPAWAQQYDKRMQPVWCRAFEPPAVSGGESQGILLALIDLYQRTGEKKYLEPVPRAISYLRKLQLTDGRLARFYELRTNKPIYFTRDREGKHAWTYDERQVTTGYGYIVESKLDQIASRYEVAKMSDAKPKRLLRRPLSKGFLASVRHLLETLDERGAWVERGRLTHHKAEPQSGVISSATFAKNVRVLSDYLRATQE